MQDVTSGRNMVDSPVVAVDFGRKSGNGELPELAVRLERKRSRSGLSIRRLAQTIGISHPTLIRYYKTGKIGYQSLHKVRRYVGERSRNVPGRSRKRLSRLAKLVLSGYYKLSISCDVQ